jgi:energy-coupling factor transport system substrate-specific component
VGIFSALYFVINFIFMLSAGLHPIMWILMPGFIALFTGIPFMLMCAKVQKPGAVLLMGIITGLIYFVTGQFTLVILVTFVVACALAELARVISKYGSFKGDTFAFVFFSLGMTGSPLPIWIMRESFLAQIYAQGMSEDYGATLEALSSPSMLIVLFAAPVVGAIFGAIITKGMFKKHFIKAGIV